MGKIVWNYSQILADRVLNVLNVVMKEGSEIITIEG